MIDQYLQLIKGKRVAIIGGGDYIDPAAHDCDLVCHINQWYPRRDDLPCNILYWRFLGPFADMEKPQGLKYCFVYFGNEYAHQVPTWCDKNKIPWEYFTLGYSELTSTMPEIMRDKLCWPRKLEEEMGCLPFTGWLAAWHILQQQPASVLMTGMDFYTSQNKTPLMQARGNHSILAHIKWIRAALVKYPNLQLDAVLTETIKSPELIEIKD